VVILRTSNTITICPVWSGGENFGLVDVWDLNVGWLDCLG
jgi:hypothetical protein